MRSPWVVLLVFAAPTLARSAEPISFAAEARYGSEAEIGAGVRATVPIPVNRRDLGLSLSLGRFFGNPIRYSEIALGLETPLLQRGAVNFYAGAGVCASRAAMTDFERGPDSYGYLDYRRAGRGIEVTRSRRELGLHVALGARLHRRVLLEARFASGRIESGLLTAGVLF